MQERSTIKYQDAAKMPYLTACVKEGMRCHTVVGAGLPRYVPPGGAEICGRFFPGGYKVQVNQTVLHRNKDIFGEDADDFRPERWFDSDEDTIKRMNKHLHPFGYGTRVCVGQHVSNDHTVGAKCGKLTCTDCSPRDIQIHTDCHEQISI